MKNSQKIRQMTTSLETANRSADLNLNTATAEGVAALSPFFVGFFSERGECTPKA
jgi:hypothetical protein